MNSRGTLVYVHGASDREAQVAEHVAEIERQLVLAGMPYDVMPSSWGQVEGARLDRLEKSLPPAVADHGAGFSETALARTLLSDEPLAELEALAGRSPTGVTAPPDGSEWRESDQLLDICRTRTISPLQTVLLHSGQQMPLAAACMAAATEVAASSQYRRARTSDTPEPVLIAAVGRAIAATVAAAVSAPEDVPGMVERRIAEAVLVVAGAAILAGYVGIDVGPDLKRWATDVLVPHRARLMREAALAPADILLYQRAGERIRQFVSATIVEARQRGGPVIALGNSLGGVVLVDTLAQPGAPRPDLLVTVGSQAPVLATIGALAPLGLPDGPPPFQPWLNIWDRRDFLAFVARPVWPDQAGIVDREVSTGFGFPDSHGLAYLRLAETYRAMREHPALSGDSPPDGGARRFPIRLGERSRPVLWLFGVRTANAYVDIDGELDARFGFFRFRTPLSNVTRWRIEGPWLWLTAIGVRRGVRDGVVSFGGNHRAGVRLDLREPVRWGPFRVPALYVTVEDLDGFGAALAARGIPGEDARQQG